MVDSISFFLSVRFINCNWVNQVLNQFLSRLFLKLTLMLKIHLQPWGFRKRRISEGKKTTFSSSHVINQTCCDPTLTLRPFETCLKQKLQRIRGTWHLYFENFQQKSKLFWYGVSDYDFDNVLIFGKKNIYNSYLVGLWYWSTDKLQIHLSYEA